MRKAIAVAVMLWLAVPPPSGSQTVDADLARGIRHAQAGEFDEAVVTLDAVAKRLAAQGGRPRDLARAYAYLSIAYLGLSQEQKAKAQFLEAWRIDPGMDLSATEFPPSVLEFFAQARKEAAPAATPVPTSTPTPVRAAQVRPTPRPSRGKSVLPLAIGGGVAAVAAGVLAAGGGGGGAAPPPSAIGPTSAPTLPPAQPTPTPTPTPVPRTEVYQKIIGQGETFEIAVEAGPGPMSALANSAPDCIDLRVFIRGRAEAPGNCQSDCATDIPARGTYVVAVVNESGPAVNVKVFVTYNP